jgi:hypothetical protein
VARRDDNMRMDERSSGGTLRGVPRRSEADEPGDATSGVVERSAGAPAPAEPRGDEYRQAVVQTIRKAKSSTLKQEKKVVIPSREARTVKVRHDEVPGLAERLKEERAQRSLGVPVETPEWVPEPPSAPPESAPSWPTQEQPKGADWVDDPPSFDSESVVKPASAEAEQALPVEVPVERSSRAALWFLLLLIASGAGVASYVFFRRGPARSADAGQLEAPARAVEPAASGSVAAAVASPDASAAVEPAPPSASEAPPASAEPAASASASAAPAARPSKAPPRPRPGSKLPPFPDF